MKRNRILSSAFAVVFSLSMALATNVSRADQAWFKLDPNTGLPIEQLDAEPTCVQVEKDPYCAGLFNMVDGEPDGSPVITHRGDIIE